MKRPSRFSIDFWLAFRLRQCHAIRPCRYGRSHWHWGKNNVTLYINRNLQTNQDRKKLVAAENKVLNREKNIKWTVEDNVEE
jgi:hypothetical protein